MKDRVKAVLERTGLRSALLKAGLWGPAASVGTFMLQPRKLLQQWEIRADYRKFERKYGSFLRDGAHLADPNRQALIVNLTGWIPQLKVESMLGKALQLQGVTPVILIARGGQDKLKY